MNVHKNARLTPHGRERIVRQVEIGQTPKAVGEAAGVCPRTVRKWVSRYRSEGLVLLCHKFWCPFRAAQHGQRESVVARAATNLRRIVAIEFGTWRSGRNGGSSGLVTFA